MDEVLTLQHYKEPLIPVKGGFGYYGAVSISLGSESKMQCHACGELFHDVARHARDIHKIFAREYREKYQLAYTTALISETLRLKKKEAYQKWWLSLTSARREKEIKRSKANKGYLNRNHENQPKLTLEDKNKRGACPDQLLQKVRDCMDELGHQPSKRQFIDWCDGSQRYTHLIRATFGTWDNMLKMLGLQRLRNPGASNGRHSLSDEELLETLSIFAQEFGRIPSATDCKRGLIPDYAVYGRRFGGLEQARKLAGVYSIIDPSTLGRWAKK